MKFTIEIEPEEFGRMISSVPPEVRQQIIDATIKSYPQMWGEYMKQAGLLPKSEDKAIATFNPFWWMPQNFTAKK